MKRFTGTIWAILLTLVLAFESALPVSASTVGTISGTVTETGTGKPLANVAVAAASASGSYRAHTDGRGFYSMTGVASDTYTVSFQLTGYEPISEPGVNVAADQVATVSVTLQHSLKTIAQVLSRGAAGAFQPHQTADTYTVTTQQMQNIQGSALNISEKSLLTALPGVQYSSGNYPTIRGGRTNNVDYEFEGMNYTDPYTQKNINGFFFPAFGLQSVQLSPGSEDETFGNSGVGTVNVTARRGTYPGTGDAALGVGGPGFFHEADVGIGNATPNGKWSNYFSYTAQNNAPRYGGIYWRSDANDIGVKDFPMYISDRELLDNMVFKFGRDNRFSLQALINTGLHTTNSGYGDPLASGLCFFSCDPNQIGAFASDTPNSFNGGQGYAGILDAAGNPHGLTLAQLQSMLVLSPGQTQIYQQLNGDPVYSEHGISNGTKLQGTWNPDSSTYVYVGWDTTNGATTSDNPNAALYRVIGGYNTEFNGGLTKQLSEKHLVRLNIHTLRSRPLNEGLFPNDELFNIAPTFGGVGELYDFVSPTDPNCPLGFDPSGNSYCGHLYNALKISGPTGTLKLIPGGAGTRITGSSFDYSIGDSWTPNSRLKFDGGIRIENHRYHLPQYGTLPDCTSYYVPVAYATPSPGVLPDGETGMFVNGKPVGPGNCPQAVFLPLTKDQTNPVVPEPRVAASYQMGLNDAVRVSYGRTARFPEGEASDYAPPFNYGGQFSGLPAFLNPGVFALTGVYNLNGGVFRSSDPNDYYGRHGIPTDCGFVGYQVPCQSYQEQLYWSVQNGDFGNPIAPLKPVTYSNYDVSYSHRFAGNVSFKVTGWARRAYNLDIIEKVPQRTLFNTVIVGPDGSVSKYLYSIPTNSGVEVADGLEFFLTKENPYGLSGQISATYNNVRQNVPSADEFHALLNPIAASGMYRVGYVSPVTSTLAASYRTHSGWRIQGRLDYDIGYPYGDGLLTSFSYGGHNLIVPHVNATNGNVLSNGNTQFVDPSNPGSVIKPNIDATLGTPESNQAQGQLSHSNLVAELTLEKTVGNGALGVQIFNLFNEAYTGPTFPNGDFGFIAGGPFSYLNSSSYYQGGAGMQLNSHYQPVATGVGGPLTGHQLNCIPDPTTGTTCLTTGGGVNGTSAYINVPNGVGRTFYVYYTLHI